MPPTGSPTPRTKTTRRGRASTLETTTDDYAQVHGGRAPRERTQRGVLERDLQAAGAHSFENAVRSRRRGDDHPRTTRIELSYGLGWGLQRTPHGWGAFKEGHGDGFQHYSIVYPAKKIGVLLMSNSDNAESIFGHLLTLTIADTFTPLEWEKYIPFDRPLPGVR